MEPITLFLITFWELSVTLGLYIFIGLLFVGIVHLYISEEWIKKHLGQGGQYDAVKGALYGIPLPLCSCGVIPLAKSLREKGASSKAVTSFFITTPMTGVDSIIATYGVFGLPMAIVRVISSLISGVLAGFLVKNESHHKEESSSSCGSCCGGCSGGGTGQPSKFRIAYNYALNEVFADIAKPILLGLVLATLFVMLVPESLVFYFKENLVLTYVMVLTLALPLYVCSVSAIPMALGLLTLGLSPGAAFIFLAAAPATNIITIGIFRKILGNSVMVVYLLSIIITTLLFAILIDYAMPAEWFTFHIQQAGETHSILHQLAGGLFIVLAAYYVLKPSLKRKTY